MSVLIETLGLDEYADKVMSELSGGNQRKVSVAIAFLSNARIVLLDEPTSSLDPIARHKVHNLINMKRGSKTFMLCTHLLDEVETLHGLIYTICTPQYLSNRFGTEWKAYLVPENSCKEKETAIDTFFTQNISSARTSIKRPLSRIYSIPSTDIKLTALFRFLQNAKDSNIGIKYFTCSWSTLEKVFFFLTTENFLMKRRKMMKQTRNKTTNNHFFIRDHHKSKKKLLSEAIVHADIK